MLPLAFELTDVPGHKGFAYVDWSHLRHPDQGSILECFDARCGSSSRMILLAATARPSSADVIGGMVL